MKFIVFVTFVFLCAPGFSQSKADKNGKKEKGTYLERLRHKETHYVISNEHAERKSILFEKLITSPGVKIGAIMFKKVPYSNGKMLYIKTEAEKRMFLEKYLMLPGPVITAGVLNMELFTTKNLNVAILYNRQLMTVSKVYKVIYPTMGLKMYKTPTTEFAVQKFKEHGVLQGIIDLFRNNPEGLEKGHVMGARLSTEDAAAFSASYSVLNVVPMYPKFNGPIYFQEMERGLLQFVGEAAYAQEEVQIMISVSPNCKMNDQMGLRSVEKVLNLHYLGIAPKRIVIPRSLAVIAYTIPKSKQEKFKVFVWVGNNDKYFPIGYFPKDLEELIPYFECNEDQSTLEGIRALAKTGYKMWQREGASSLLKH